MACLGYKDLIVRFISRFVNALPRKWNKALE